ncbi:MAG: Hyaluronan synthase [Calditrichaeota bacterium]|nr:Hyaluronan synthase [Calditrichota bacterium]
MLRDAPFASVLTIHRGPTRDLERMRTALLAQSYPADRFEWVVVDDASPGPQPDWLDAWRGPFSLNAVRLEHNAGRAAARNTALSTASGEIVAFLDSDMEPVPVWLEMHVRAVLGTGGVIVGRYDLHPSLPSDAFLRYAHTRGVHKHPPGACVPGRYFVSGNSAFPRALHETYGGFDERFTGWGGEDLEYGLRFERAGVPIHYEPRARSFHDHRVTWERQEERYRRFGRHALPLLLAKYPEAEHLLSLSRLRNDPRAGFFPGIVQPAALRAVCRESAYRRVRDAVRRAPNAPWPAFVFDYMVFHLYSRGYEGDFGR